ncbi:aminotransferase class IV [Neokomagataea thailandica]|uniref:aminotransferase class IV n=1 Tax=Neokomagataea TaxID=1223423 RepID=UPI000836E278|nr:MULTISPECIES: aminotransferase class IV [Neokomagataea]
MSTSLWLNNALIPSENAHIAPTDRGFLLADGLFETLRITRGTLPHFALHMKRFTAGCHTLRLPPPDPLYIRRACECVLQANQHTEGSLRITLTRGPGPRGLAPSPTPHPTLLITSAPQPHTTPADVTLHISRYTRPPLSPLSAVKSLSYLPSIMARIEATDAGYDDALMLCPQGQYVASGTSGTLIIELRNRLYTPPLQSGALPGISRSRIIKSGLCAEKNITPEDYRESSSAYLINSLSITSISKKLTNHNTDKKDLIGDFLFL